ncbi:DUF2897 family protein [Bowmanella pacifica]|uniref:DUF2897 domain-containing protein n=1 Tax=Bowmanella pacifica TaxID=502051 RepID=A0A917Z0I8_9ALTE|nr:DUF2897 family protein [Bowmanella pacifica]GGO70696.1 hypothetical protein GCM10010982_24820 [Bowmanella pacifica]
MSWTVALIIALALGVIVGNLLLLKQTANHKLPSLKDKHPENQTSDDKNSGWDDEEDDYPR